MPKLKVYLSIGYSSAIREDIIEIDDELYNSCKTDDEKEDLCNEHWKEWIDTYIDGYYEIVD